MTNQDPNSLSGAISQEGEPPQVSFETLKELEERVRVMKAVKLTDSESVARSSVMSLEMQLSNETDWRKKASIAAKIARLNLDTY